MMRRRRREKGREAERGWDRPKKREERERKDCKPRPHACTVVMLLAVSVGCSPDMTAVSFASPPFVTAEARPFSSAAGKLELSPGIDTAGCGGAAAPAPPAPVDAATSGLSVFIVGVAPTAISAASRVFSEGVARGVGSAETGGKPAGLGVALSGTNEDARCFLLRRSASLSSAVEVVAAGAAVEAAPFAFDCGRGSRGFATSICLCELTAPAGHQAQTHLGLGSLDAPRLWRLRFPACVHVS